MVEPLLGIKNGFCVSGPAEVDEGVPTRGAALGGRIDSAEWRGGSGIVDGDGAGAKSTVLPAVSVTMACSL